MSHLANNKQNWGCSSKRGSLTMKKGQTQERGTLFKRFVPFQWALVQTKKMPYFYKNAKFWLGNPQKAENSPLGAAEESLFWALGSHTEVVFAEMRQAAGWLAIRSPVWPGLQLRDGAAGPAGRISSVPVPHMALAHQAVGNAATHSSIYFCCSHISAKLPLLRPREATACLQLQKQPGQLQKQHCSSLTKRQGCILLP